ncbi:MAG: hypothetical protein H8F28_00195 [Fibrella sp.]|nr:hypothetical protein [Armatimonadota bacterium]
MAFPLRFEMTAFASSDWRKLEDDKDGKPDTLRVYAIRHAASKPFPDFEDEEVAGR